MGGRPERCPALFRAPAPFTCHEHHEDRAAPLGRRDGGRNGALEPQHLSTPAWPPCSLEVLSSRTGAGPALPFAGPRGPGSPSWPAPRLRLRRDAHTQRSSGTRANARAGSAWRHVMPHVAVGMESHCPVWLARWRVRAPARPEARQSRKWKEPAERVTKLLQL